MPRSTTALAREPMIARHEGDLSAFNGGPFQRGWKVVLLSAFSDPDLGNYATIPDSSGGRNGLKKAVQQAHDAGAKVLFMLDGAHISKTSAIGRVSGEAWAVRGFNGRPVEENGRWVLCPASAEWREWLANTSLRLLHLYGADGIAITGLAGAPYHLCISRNHGHGSPYAWTWGIRRLFQDLRIRMTQEAPGALLISDGALDIAREFTDALVADTQTRTGYRMEYPLLRAVYPNIRVYEDVYAPDAALSERLRAWNLAQGLPFYAPNVLAATVGPTAPRALYEAYPEVFDTPYVAAPVVTPSRDLVAEALTGRDSLLTLGNLSDEPFTGALRLPFKALALEDKVRGLRVEPDAQGAFPLALLPRQGAFWRIIPVAPLHP
jgi:hypothetical protein